MSKIAILDASGLMSLYALDALKHLILFFERVLIPRKVEQEFLLKFPNTEEPIAQRLLFIEQQHNLYPWLIKCQEYSNDLIALYNTEKGIDDGEAEVFAQNQHNDNSCLLILDDQKARKLAVKRNLLKIGTLKLLAEMEIRFQLLNYYEAVQTLHEKRKFYASQKTIDDIYTATKNQLL
jgi:predicted nucleic acid-binding protein